MVRSSTTGVTLFEKVEYPVPWKRMQFLLYPIGCILLLLSPFPGMGTNVFYSYL